MTETAISLDEKGGHKRRNDVGQTVSLFFAVLCGAALLAFPAAALDPNVSINQYGHRKWQSPVLPQNTIYAIAQTPDGYLWLATQNGLARFDGVRFQTFTSFTTPELKMNYILSLMVDRTGALWIGTGGNGVVRYRDGRFSNEGGLFLRNSGIYVMNEAPDGSIWMGSSAGVVRRDPHGRYTRELVTSSKAILHDRLGNLWIGTPSGLIRKSARGTDSFTVRDGLPTGGVECVYEDRSGTVWVGTEQGLARFEHGRLVADKKHITKLRDVPIRTILEDYHGNLWVGTDAGLHRITRGTQASFTPEDGLSGPTVRTLFEDRERNLWVGTNSAGLNQFRDTAFAAYDRRHGFSSDVVLCTLRDRSGTLWAGTDGGGVCRLGKDGTTKCLTARHGLGQGAVWTLAEDASGAIWIGTYGGGLSRYVAGKITTYTTKDGLTSNAIMSLLPDGDRLWIGTTGGGLNLLRKGQFTAYTSAHGISGDRIVMIAHARRGGIWVSSIEGGLVRFADGAVREHLPVTPRAVRDVVEDADGTLWLGTTGEGLFRIRGRSVTRYGTAQGMFGNDVHNIVDDGRGTFWLTSNTGLARVRRTELNDVAEGRRKRVRQATYGIADGLPTSEFNAGNPGWLKESGTMWLSTMKGLVAFQPAKLRMSNSAIPVVIEEVRADGRPLAPENSIVSAKMRRISLTYTGISLRDPDHTRFRYRLDGFDTDWVDAGVSRAATYTNLAPGRYLFRVRACNADEVCGEATGYSFTRHRSFSETLWFRGMCAIALMLALAAIVRLRLHALKRRARHLESLVAQRTELLAEANESLLRISLTDPLTGVGNRRCFDEQLEREWDRATRRGTSLSLLIFDVDHFKKYNDSYGHQEGDRCLVSIAKAAEGCVRRQGDLVARYGGEEFVVILPDVEPDVALKIAESMRARIENLRLPHMRSETADFVTISVGAAFFARSLTASRDLIEAADKALYESKRSGRNRVSAYAEEAVAA